MRKMEWKKTGLLFIGLVLLMGSCRNASKGREEKYTLTVATLNGPSAISMVKMMRDSMLNDSVMLHFFVKNEPNLVKPMILQQRVDIAILPTNMASILFNMGAKYRLAAIPVWGTLYVFGQDSTVNGWKDMKGKHIYLMGRGMTPDIMFRYLLAANHLDPGKDIHADYSFPTHLELGNAVAAGKATLGVISEPMVTIAMAKNKNVKRLLSLETEWNRVFNDTVPFAQTALLVSDSLLINHPRWVAEFMHTYKNAINWVNANREDAARLVVRYGIMPDTTIAAQTIPGCRLEYKDAWPMRKGIDNYLNVFYGFDPAVTGGRLPSEDFYVNPDSLK